MTQLPPEAPAAPIAPEPPSKTKDSILDASPVNNSDLYFLGGIGLFTMIIVIAFGAMIVGTGLLQFPIKEQNQLSSQLIQAFETVRQQQDASAAAIPETSVNDPITIIKALNQLAKASPASNAAELHELNSEVLDYRERRMTLNLILRTFTITFSFLVGLVMCIYGGLFLIRRVETYTELSGSIGRDKPATQSGPVSAVTSAVSQPKSFSLKSYSPGIIFMFGGLAVIGWTQYATPPVTGPEIVPLNFRAFCASQAGVSWNDCTKDPALTRSDENSNSLNTITMLANRNIQLKAMLQAGPLVVPPLDGSLDAALKAEDKVDLLSSEVLNEVQTNHRQLQELRSTMTTAISPQLTQLLEQANQASASAELNALTRKLDLALWKHAIDFAHLKRLASDLPAIETKFDSASEAYQQSLTDYEKAEEQYTNANPQTYDLYTAFKNAHESLAKISEHPDFRNLLLTFSNTVSAYNTARNKAIVSNQAVETEAKQLKLALDRYHMNFPAAAPEVNFAERFEHVTLAQNHKSVLENYKEKTGFSLHSFKELPPAPNN